MSAAVHSLLALASLPAERIEARAAWVRATCAALRQAQQDMDATCTAAVDRLSEEAFERLCAAEQAKVDTIRGPIDAVIERICGRVISTSGASRYGRGRQLRRSSAKRVSESGSTGLR